MMTMKATVAAVSVGLMLGMALTAYVVMNYPSRQAMVILAVVVLCLTGVVVTAGMVLRATFRKR